MAADILLVMTAVGALAISVRSFSIKLSFLFVLRAPVDVSPELGGQSCGNEVWPAP